MISRRKGLWVKVFGVAVAAVLLLGLVASNGSVGRDYRGFIVGLINGGKPDRDAVVAAFTWDEGLSSLIARPASLPKKYDPDEMFKTLFSVKWAADSKVESLFTWIANDNGNIGDTNEAFARVFKFLSDTSKYNKSATGKGALGKINPKLTDAVRVTARPYHNILAGGSAEYYGIYSFYPPRMYRIIPRTVRFYSILVANPDIGNELVRDAQAQVNRNAVTATKKVSGQDRYPHPFELGLRSGFIQIFIDQGYDENRAKTSNYCTIPECWSSMWKLNLGYAMLATQPAAILPPGWVSKGGKLKPLSEIIDYVNGAHKKFDTHVALNTESQIDDVLRTSKIRAIRNDFQEGRYLAWQSFYDDY